MEWEVEVTPNLIGGERILISTGSKGDLFYGEGVKSLSL